jgi:hypothetical protein
MELPYIINKPERIIGVFVGFSRIFLLGILIFEGLTARRLYKSFGVKGLIPDHQKEECVGCRRNQVGTVIHETEQVDMEWQFTADIS